MNRRATMLVPTVLLLLARGAGAVPVDGQLDPRYGLPIVTQSTQTDLHNGGQIVGDNNENDLNWANGSELDAAYAYTASGVMYLFFSGNVASEPRMTMGSIGHTLDLFVDTGPGGKNILTQLGSGNPLNGLTLDPGFDADYVLEFLGEATGGMNPQPFWSAYYGPIPTMGSTTMVYLGSGQAGGPGTLAGGTNPHGILASIDNHNVGGVGLGCGSASGAGVTTGIEWAIPLAALGNPAGCIRITALLRTTEPTTSNASNSSLAPMPPGTCPPGSVSTLNLGTIAGDQYFTVCPATTAAPAATTAGLALSVGPNPTPGDRVWVTYTLPDHDRPAELALIDCASRVVREQRVGGARGAAEMSQGRALSPGVYWLRLSQGVTSVARRLCIVN